VSKVIGVVTLLDGRTIELTQACYGYGDHYGWCENGEPGSRRCTGFDTMGQALDAALEALAVAA
jgi:hypothetical protein